MKKEILVTVIVPVYNVEKYIERCIESIIKQSYKNLQIILVNDGSTDSSGEKCDYFKTLDSRIEVIHKVNGGLSDARNAGLDLAKGEYISFVDSDDWIEINMIEEFMNNIFIQEADIAIGRRFRAYEDGTKILESFLKYPEQNLFGKEEGLRYLMSFCGYDMSVCDKVFKKEILKGIKFPFGKTCEDSFTTYKIFSNANKIIYIDKGVYNYYYRINSITRNSTVNETVIEATKEQLNFIKNRYPLLIAEASSSYITAIISVENENIKRNKKWTKYGIYKKEAMRYLKVALKNKNISLMKKIQFLIFCLSEKIYLVFYKYSQKNK